MSTVEYDPHSIETKWQRRWSEAALFDAEPAHDADGEPLPKFFVNFPYPYMNGFLHVGHSFTLMRVELLARYKRMCGYNTLFPFAFHCTGTPIIAAAERIRDGEPTQFKIMADMGVDPEEIPRFAEPEYWTTYFPRETKRDCRRLGLAIDWRRSFITTSLNAYYDRFIQWQFRKLKAADRVQLGEHPVIWCPKCNNPVGDHARLEGEGETPQEQTLLKFAFEPGSEVGHPLPEEYRRGEGSDPRAVYLITATLRPETVFGQTNLWVDPEVAYVRAVVDEEVWIVSREAATKLEEQAHAVEIVDEIRGEELIGKTALAPQIHTPLIILPSGFCDPAVGSGIVTSVPSDAPDDWMGLYDLQRDEEEMARYGLDPDRIRAIEPIAIIESEGWGEYPAVEICEEMGIENQYEREKLLKAKKQIYKSGFYTGVMNERCEQYAGMKVEAAKEAVKAEMIERDEATLMYEPSGTVTCRCLTPCVVKVVRNQWFLAYDDEKWKADVHEAVDSMHLWPPRVTKQFHNVVDWLDHWACTREFGLGTRLPWDEKWLIESLSDSTIYMAYYTVAHYFEEEGVVAPERIDDTLFDHIFLGEGDPAALADEHGLDPQLLARMRNEFVYWYPFDFRGSGKDLIQNHLCFCLFNHTAIFSQEFWPCGFGVNGWVRVDGAKMSKSRGNFYTLREVISEFGADPVRLALGYAGEGIDDPNFDTDFLKTAPRRLEALYEQACDYHPPIENDTNDEAEDIDDRTLRHVDRWFLSVLNRTIAEVRDAMETTNFRTALKYAYFDLQNQLKRYLRRCGDAHSPVVMRAFVSAQIRMLAPYIPHFCEEVWEALGYDGFISTAPYPEPDDSVIDRAVEEEESYLDAVVDDINSILKVTKLDPTSIYIYTTPKWKRAVFETALDKLDEGDLAMGTMMKTVMTDPALRKRGKAVSTYVRELVAEMGKLSANEQERLRIAIDEEAVLDAARGYLETLFDAECHIHSADDDECYDPVDKAAAAVPRRPAIYIEEDQGDHGHPDDQR